MALYGADKVNATFWINIAFNKKSFLLYNGAITTNSLDQLVQIKNYFS